MAGISAWHGMHQVAQKLISTTCPRNAESVTGCPLRLRRVKSGAGAPVTGAAAGVAVGPPGVTGGAGLGQPANSARPTATPTIRPAATIKGPARLARVGMLFIR